MVLQQINMIDLKPFQRSIYLSGGSFLGSAINLCHDERFLSVSTLRKRFPNAHFAAAFVVVP